MPPPAPGRAPGPPTPVAWYEVLASPDPVPAAPADEPAEEADSAGVRRALFGSIDTVAVQEEKRRIAGAPESPALRQLRTDASAEARRVLAAAREEAKEILKESRDQGYKAGYGAGYSVGAHEAVRQMTERADTEREAYREELSSFVSGVEDASRSAWQRMEPEILDLVLEIARKVIKMEVELNREAAIEIVKNTLRRVADSTSLRIRVHADDLETVRANREDLYTLVDSIRKVEIVEDRRVGQGGCIVETDAGTIDARIETQLEEIRKLLLNAKPQLGE
jgi:flagellar assembly protein FliH